MQLRNRTAVITGAGAGIGKAIAEGFAREGARLTLVDIDAKKAEATAAGIRQQGGDAVSFEADVASPASVESLAKFVIAKFGTVDILVNDAAIQVNKTIEDTTPEEWNRQMAVNVGGVFLCSRAFLPALR
jgi:NAD(P)-dependent dehydrogenase (short-subunit alcohol dehydrogenase family)